MMELETQLAVDAGDGLLMRHRDVVLFVPRVDENAEALVDVVRANGGVVDATFDALADRVVELQFAVPDFACVGLGERLKIRVFGGIEVVTDLASAPMLSGAGSTTWVEHGAALPADGGVTVSIGHESPTGNADRPSTDLVEGRVPAGGFRLLARRPDVGDAAREEAPADENEDAVALTTQSEEDGRVAAALDALGPAPTTSEADTTNEDIVEQGTVDQDSVEQGTVAEDVAEVGVVEASTVEERGAAESVTEAEPMAGEQPALAETAPVEQGSDDVEASVPSAMSQIEQQPVSDFFEKDLADADVESGGVGVAGGETIVPPADLLDAPPPPSAEQIAATELPPPPPPNATPPPPTAGGPMVMARPCPSGHANRPSRVTCSICEAFLPSGQEALAMMSRPPVGQLVFSDGTRHALDKNLVVGRAPTAPDGVDCDLKIVRSDQISRRHLEISVNDWDVYVVDCGSRNGTVLTPTDGAAPVKVEPDMPQLIEPGAAIHFADQTITLVAAGESPVAVNGNETDRG